MSLGPGGPSSGSYTGIVTVLQQLVQGQAAILSTLQKLAGGITANYASGAWTPALAFGGASVGLTYTSRSGKYTQVGGLIIAEFSIVLSAVGSSAGAATIGGLPVASIASGSSLLGAYSALATISGPVILTVPAGSSVNLLASGAAATSALTNSNFTSTSNFQGSVIYWAS